MSDGGSQTAALLERLRASIGKKGREVRAQEAVNQPLIERWCEAMSDRNPVYTEPEVAARASHGQIVAPPAMLAVWTLDRARPADRDDPRAAVVRELEAAGFTSGVATHAEHAYARYLHVGERLSEQLTLTDVSELKKTAVGIGHFVTATTIYRSAAEEVGRVRLTVLKFKPGTGRVSAGRGERSGSLAPRPVPRIGRDTRFFWDGLDAGELRIQKCARCGRLEHPPCVRCPGCGSDDLGYEVASGRATLHSFVEPVHPSSPGFEARLVVGLVDLEEGTRLVTNVVDVEPERVRIGMPLELAIRKPDGVRSLPLFRPPRPARRQQTPRSGEVEVGQLLEPCPVDITAALIIAGATAARTDRAVHHDRAAAIERGLPDILMDILTTSGLCTRYVSDWAGPDARLRSLRIGLGVPNHPGHVMTLSGEVTAKSGSLVEVSLRGRNQLGNHVTGTAAVELVREDR
jgi:uncharacterized OB-fold protein